MYVAECGNIYCTGYHDKCRHLSRRHHLYAALAAVYAGTP